MVERTGLRTIAYGSGAIDRLELPNIPISADVAVGDRLMTSGLGGLFPRGIPIGRVQSIDDRGSALFHYAQVAPAVDFARIDEVLLLIGDATRDVAAQFPGAG